MQKAEARSDFFNSNWRLPPLFVLPFIVIAVTIPAITFFQANASRNVDPPSISGRTPSGKIESFPSLSIIKDHISELGERLEIYLGPWGGGNPPLVYAITGLPEGMEFIRDDYKVVGALKYPDIYDVAYAFQDEDGDQRQSTSRIIVVDFSSSEDE